MFGLLNLERIRTEVMESMWHLFMKLADWSGRNKYIRMGKRKLILSKNILSLFYTTAGNLILGIIYWSRVSKAISKHTGINKDIFALAARSMILRIWVTSLSISLMTQFKKNHSITVNISQGINCRIRIFRGILTRLTRRRSTLLKIKF